MKIKILFLFVLSSIIACSSSQETATQSTAAKQAVNTSTDALISYQNEITSTYLRNHLTPFAADSMMGRETGTEGQKKAARFLAEQYESLGLKPVGDNNTYFQKYDLTAHRTDSVVFTLSTNDEMASTKLTIPLTAQKLHPTLFADMEDPVQLMQKSFLQGTASKTKRVVSTTYRVQASRANG